MVAKKPVKRVAKKVVKCPQDMDLEEFKALVVEKTNTHPEACEYGKIDFLKSLGLELPHTKVSFTAKITIAFAEGANVINNKTAQQAIIAGLEEELYVKVSSSPHRSVPTKNIDITDVTWL